MATRRTDPTESSDRSVSPDCAARPFEFEWEVRSDVVWIETRGDGTATSVRQVVDALASDDRVHPDLPLLIDLRGSRWVHLDEDSVARLVDDMNARPGVLCRRRAFLVGDAYTEVLSRIGAIRGSVWYDTDVRVLTRESDALAWLTKEEANR